MSNTVHHRIEGRQQFQGLWDNAICVKGVVDFESIGSNATGQEVVSVPGAALGNMVVASFGADTTGLVIWAHVAAADTVHIHAHNVTGGPMDLASMTFHLIILRPVNL